MKTRFVALLVVGLFVLCMGVSPSETVAQLAYPSLPTSSNDQSLRPPDLWNRSLPLASSTDTTQSRVFDSNLLLNGSFEQGESSPTGWSSDAWNSSYTVFSLDSTQAISGSRSVKIETTVPNDARWIQTVSVLPNTDYRLTGWIKTENVARTGESVDAGANLCLYGTYTRSEGLYGTNDWTHISMLFNTGSNTEITVAARLGYWSGTTTGVAWFDDLQLELLHIPTPLIKNPGFESGSARQPDDWWTESIEEAHTFEWDSAVAHSGNRSVKVSAPELGIGRWSQTVLVDQDSEYRLAGWIKTLDVQDPPGQWWVDGARIGVYGMDSWLAAATPGLRGTVDWTYASVPFITGSTNLAKVTCTLGQADPLYARPHASGTVWCDDFSLTKIRVLPRTYLGGEHMAIDVYTEDYDWFDDPVTYLAHLDEVYEAMRDLVNGVPYDGGPITVRSDASIYYGLLSGNPITIGPGHSWMDIVNAHGIDFGVPHELGHDFDLWPQSRLYMGGEMDFDGAEHWANFKLLYAYDLLGAQYPGLTQDMWGHTVPLSQVGQYWVAVQARPWIDAGRTDYWNMHHDVYTGLLYTLVQQVGWEPFWRTFHEYSQSTLPPPASDVAKVELLANKLSQYSGVNLIPAFQSWGFPVQAITPTQTPTPTAIATSTSTPTCTPTLTLTATVTPTSTSTSTRTPTPTPTSTTLAPRRVYLPIITRSN